MKFYQSKKFWATVTGVCVAVGTNYLGLDEESISKILQVLSVYVIGQGVADIGKHAK